MSMAMAYNMKKRAKKCHGGKMAFGGESLPAQQMEPDERIKHPDESDQEEKMSPEQRSKFNKDQNRPMHEGVHASGGNGKSVAHQIGGATEKYLHKQKHSELQQMNKKKDMGMGYPKHFAKGGMMTGSGYQSDCAADCNDPAHIHEEASGFVGHEGDDVKHNGMAMHEDDMGFNQHGDSDEGAGGMDEMSPIVRKIMMGRMNGYAEGGEAGVHMPLVKKDVIGMSSAGAGARTVARHERGEGVSKRSSDAMRTHAKSEHQRVLGEMRGMKKGYPDHFSEGGKVANDTPPEADFEDNDFDYLAKNDDLEFHDTGANSGDELGDEQEDHDRKDIVSRIMKSRKKKDRMPNPA